MESLLGLTLGENAEVTGLQWRQNGGQGEGEGEGKKIKGRQHSEEKFTSKKIEINKGKEKKGKESARSLFVMDNYHL